MYTHTYIGKLRCSAHTVLEMPDSILGISQFQTVHELNRQFEAAPPEPTVKPGARVTTWQVRGLYTWLDGHKPTPELQLC